MEEFDRFFSLFKSFHEKVTEESFKNKRNHIVKNLIFYWMILSSEVVLEKEMNLVK